MTTITTLQERAGFQFEDESLLQRALTHRSYLNEHPDVTLDNERLEFLGDAVLAFLIASMLYNRFPEMQEGQLTRLRSSLVRTEQLAAFAQQWELGSVMHLGKGEIKGGGQTRLPLLCDAFEAVVGAIYLDQGITKTREFVEKLFWPVALEMVHEQALVDSKSFLQEWVQEHFNQTPYYVTTGATGPDHEKMFTVEMRLGEETHGVGTGNTKQAAEQEAAKKALKKFGAI